MYARPASVELALQLLDESLNRPDTHVIGNKFRVNRAKFEQHGCEFVEEKFPIRLLWVPQEVCTKLGVSPPSTVN